MKLLLDTHAFIWWDAEPAKLSAAVLSALQDPANDLLLSTASVWELVIKVQLGKLSLQTPLATLLVAQQANASGDTVRGMADAETIAGRVDCGLLNRHFRVNV